MFSCNPAYTAFTSACLAAHAALRVRSFSFRAEFFLRVATCFAILPSSLSLRLPIIYPLIDYKVIYSFQYFLSNK
jgi:hypothetical protein